MVLIIAIFNIDTAKTLIFFTKFKHTSPLHMGIRYLGGSRLKFVELLPAHPPLWYWSRTKREHGIGN